MKRIFTLISSTRSTERLHILFAILVLAIAGALASKSLEVYRVFFGMYHDDGIYLVAAKALAENLGYTIISLPGCPPETKYPIGFPFLLSLIWRLCPDFPQNLTALLILQVVASFAAVVSAVCYLASTKKTTIPLALVIMSACLLNFHFLDFAPMIMSDMPFALASIAALWLAERVAADERTKPTSVVASGLLVALCATLRTQGIVVVLTCIIFLAVRKRTAAALGIAGITAAILAPQVIWQTVARAECPQYLSFYTNYVSHAYETLPDLQLLAKEAQSCFNWSVLMQINTYFPFLQNIEYERLSPLQFQLTYRLIYPLLIAPLLIGLFVGVRRASLPAVYLLLHALSLSVWPVRLEWRHIFTVLPLSYYLYFLGIRSISKRLKCYARPCRSLFRKGCAASSIAFSSYLILGAATESSQYVGVYQYLNVSPTVVIDRVKLAEENRLTDTWIRAHTPEQAIFISNNDPALYLYTNRQALLPSPLEIWRFVKMRLVDAQSLLAAIHFAKASYILAEPTFRGSGLSMSQTDAAIASLQQQFPNSIRLVFTSPGRLMRVYEVSRDKLPKQLESFADH